MAIAPELPRYVRLRRWMAGYGITDRALSEKLGITAQAVNKTLKNDTMPTRHHEQCLTLGFPQDLLPYPCDIPPGRMKVEPFFPGLEAPQADA